MASSDFWRDLAAAFRALPDYHYLDATYSTFPGGLRRWHVGAGPGTTQEFDTLAMRGSAALEPGMRERVETDSLRDAWLYALMQVGHFESSLTTVEVEGSAEPIRHFAKIPKVCEASLISTRRFG